MIPPTLRRLFGYDKPVAGRSRPRRRVRPTLEVLECRVVPATLTVDSAPGEIPTTQAAVNAAQPFVDVGSTGNTVNQNQLQNNASLDAEDQTTGTGTDNAPATPES